MTLEQCYESFGGDLAATVSRMGGSLNLVKKIAVKFISDTSAAELEKALNAKDCETAFRMAHTLKGLALNLGFTSLAATSSELTELLRTGSMDGYEEPAKKTFAEYDRLISALSQLE